MSRPASNDNNRQFLFHYNKNYISTSSAIWHTSAGLMLTKARGNHFPEPPYLRKTKTYHSQPLESTRHAGNYFVPISIRPIFIFCCRSYVKLLKDYWRTENFSLLPEAPLRPEACGICHICYMVYAALWHTTRQQATLQLNYCDTKSSENWKPIYIMNSSLYHHMTNV